MELAATARDFGCKINIYTAHGLLGHSHETSNQSTVNEFVYELNRVTLRPC